MESFKFIVTYLGSSLIGVICFIFLFVSGCATSIDPSEMKNTFNDISFACAYYQKAPFGVGNCIGSIDVNYFYKNPKFPLEKHEERFHKNTSLDKYYVAQKDTNSCYAAALTTAFNSFGYEYKQEQFIEAISNTCFGIGEMPMTFSAIVYAATKVHLVSGEQWYIVSQNDSLFPDKNPTIEPKFVVGLTIPGEEKVCLGSDGFSSHLSGGGGVYFHLMKYSSPIINQQPPNPLDPPMYRKYFNPYHQVLWEKIINNRRLLGGIIPIKDTEELVYYFKKDIPILVGLVQDNSGHVVIVQSISYFENEKTDVQKYLHMSQTYIKSVKIIDPGSPNYRFRSMSGDDFINSTRFLIAIYDSSPVLINASNQ